MLSAAGAGLRASTVEGHLLELLEVVRSPRLGVAEHGVRLSDELEVPRCLILVASVAVWVVLEGQEAVLALELLLVEGARQTEHRVMVRRLCHEPTRLLPTSHRANAALNFQGSTFRAAAQRVG